MGPWGAAWPWGPAGLARALGGGEVHPEVLGCRWLQQDVHPAHPATFTNMLPNLLQQILELQAEGLRDLEVLLGHGLGEANVLSLNRNPLEGLVKAPSPTLHHESKIRHLPLKVHELEENFVLQVQKLRRNLTYGACWKKYFETPLMADHMRSS